MENTKSVVVPLEVYAVIIQCNEYLNMKKRGQIVIKFDGSKITSVDTTQTRRPETILSDVA
jgi:hypothetical protein